MQCDLIGIPSKHLVEFFGHPPQFRPGVADAHFHACDLAGVRFDGIDLFEEHAAREQKEDHRNHQQGDSRVGFVPPLAFCR